MASFASSTSGLTTRQKNLHWDHNPIQTQMGNGLVNVIPFNRALHSAGLLRLYEEAFAGGDAITSPTHHADLAQMLQQMATSTGFVCVVDGGGVVGGITVYDHPQRKDVCIVANLVTDVRFRRRGIASGVLRGVIRAAKQRRLTHVALQVDATNEAAIGLYQSFGFERVGEVAYLTLDSAVMPRAYVSRTCQVRPADSADAATLLRLIQINIPRSLTLTEQGIAVTDDAITWWVGKESGKLIGAMCSQLTKGAVEIELMLDPKASRELGTGFLLDVLRHSLRPNATHIIAKQSAHALMNLWVLRNCGFSETMSILHFSLQLSQSL